MTSNIFSKTVKKTTLWAVIITILVAAAIVVCAMFGFNKDMSMKDYKTVSISIDGDAYKKYKDEVIADSEEIFGNMNAEYRIDGKMGEYESEIVFVFDKSADVLTAKTNLENHIATKTAAGGEWEFAFISVSASNEVVTGTLAEGFVLRCAVAVVIFAVLAFAYAAIRFKSVLTGVAVGVSVLVGMLLTTALIILTRVIVTPSVAVAIAMAGLMTAATTLLTVGRVKNAEKEENAGSNEEIVANNVAAKEVIWFAAILVVGMLLVGILGRTAAAWFAVSAIIAVVASVFTSLIFAPAAYLSAKTVEDAKPAKDGYVGAKKTSTKQKKVKEPAKEEVKEETPVATTEEERVEETVPVEEAVETPVEEPSVEEAPVEETEEKTEE